MFNEQPDGKPPDDRRVADAMLKLLDVTEQLVHGQADLRADVGELKAGQEALRADVGELKAGQKRLEGSVGDLRGEKYETKFREDLPVQIRQVCRVADLPQPETIVLRWDDSRRGDERTWHTLADELGIDPYSRLRDCDFLYVVKWQALPRLWLAGEVSITIDDDLLLKVAGHRRDLKAADNEARTLAVGAGFPEAFISRNGPDAVAATGAQWVERPKNRNSLAWRDTSFMEALLAEWFAEVRPNRVPDP